jgi:hypothetical protein
MGELTIEQKRRLALAAMKARNKPSAQPTPPPEMVFDPRRQQYVDTAAAAERMGSAQGAVATYLQATPFVGEYVDEAMGKLRHAQTGEPPEIAAGIMQQSRQQFREDYPKTATGVEVGSAVIGSLPAIAAAGPAISARAPASVAGQGLYYGAIGAGAGGVEGTVSGYGESGIQGAISRGRVGGAIGGVLGTAAPMVSAGINRLVKSVLDKPTKEAAKELGVSEDVIKLLRQSTEGEDLAGMVGSISQAGPRAMPVDASQELASLLDTAIQKTGGRSAQKAVSERAAAANADLTAVMDDIFGAPAGKETAKAGVRSGTAQARREVYDAAYSQPIDYASEAGQSIEAMMRRIPEDVLRKANRLMKVKGEKSSQILFDVADDGTVTMSELPDVRQLDYITRALQDTAKTNEGAGALGGQTAIGQAYKTLAREIRLKLRTAVPEYGQALDTASDAIGRVDAIETGYSMLRPNVRREAIRESLKGASKAERREMMGGVRSYIEDTLANVKRTITDPNIDAREAMKAVKDMSSRASRDKLKMLLGKERATRLFDQIDEAAVALNLRASVVENSKTFTRQQVEKGVEAATSDTVLSKILRMEPLSAKKRLTELMTNTTPEAIEARKRGIYKELSEVLTRIGTAKALRVVRMIARTNAAEPMTDAKARIITRALTELPTVALHQTTTRSLTR